MMKGTAQTSLTRCLLLLCLVCAVTAFIDSDGECSIFAFVPFTIEYAGTVFPAGSLAGEGLSYAFSHMAAALMAVKHFNDRNPVIVPELADLNASDCNVKLKLDNTSVIDTGTLTKLASQRLFEKSEEQGSFPCAIVGPFNDFPASELAAIAQATKIPMVLHRGYNARLVSDFFSGFTSQVFPDMIESTENLVKFLLQKGRTNYIAFLYAFSDVNFQRRENLGFEFDKRDMRWTSSAYINPLAGGTFATDERTPLEALRRIRETGFRTVIVAMETSWSEVQAIADAAESLGMNQGNYMWVFFDTGLELQPFFAKNDNMTKLVSGSMWTLPLPFEESGPFEMAWASQGKEDVDRLNEVNPIMPGQPGYMFANDTFFQDFDMAEYGSRFIYDAVMTIGIGACRAQKEEGRISGDSHLRGVREVDFTGASGRVAFGNDDNDADRLGTRIKKTVAWGVFNLRGRNCTGLDECIVVTDYQNPEGFIFKTEQPFIFADGTDQPPPLIDDTKLNYLSTGLRAAGLSLMSVAMVLAIFSSLFIFLHRKHRVLTASQPPFLYLVCLGAFAEASAIFTISFDEGAGWSQDQLSKACMATPWVLSMGHITVYSALFTKMWRVHEVLQFKRRQIKIQHVAWPMLILITSALIVLTLWTILDPLTWTRVEIDSIESIGECNSDHLPAFVVPLAVLAVAPMIVTGYFAWKTRDVDNTYTESQWIFILFLVQLEVLMIATPIVVLLKEVSAEGRYFGLALMFWVFPMSALGLILLPKYVAHRRAIRGQDGETKAKRGQTLGVRVTGAEHRTMSQATAEIKESGYSCSSDPRPSDEFHDIVSAEAEGSAP